MAGKIIEVPLEWEIAHNEVVDCLAGFAPGWVDVMGPEMLGPSYSLFRLSHHELGALGTVKVKKIGLSATTVSFDGPPKPSDEEVFRREAQRLEQDRRFILLDKMEEAQPSQLIAIFLFEGVDLQPRKKDSQESWTFSWPEELGANEKRRLKVSARQALAHARQSLYWDRCKHLHEVIHVWREQFLDSAARTHAQSGRVGPDISREVGQDSMDVGADGYRKSKRITDETSECHERLPKRLKTRRKYAHIYYNLVKVIREDYYEELGRSPKVTEIKDAIVPELGVNYSVGAKTLRKIVKLGDRECLHQYRE